MAARRAGIVSAIGFFLAFPTLTSGPAEGSSLMMTGGLTSQPIGHFQFCQVAPEECSIRPRDDGPLKLTDDLWRTIVSINSAVNRAVTPMSDIDIYGEEEVWAYPVNGVGDCEDYVLEKRRLLHEAGIPLSNLLITVVRKRDGEGHAVLTVRTDRGDFILDNLNKQVVLWSKTDYSFLKRQASNHTGRWVSLRSENNVLVGAVGQ